MTKESKKARDSFVGKVVADPNNPPNTLLLSGYLGDSSEADHTRLYFDAQLSAYIEIPDKAILHVQEVEGDLGGHRVWVDQDAEYVYGRSAQQKPKAKFFEGQIMQNYGAAAQAAQANAAQANAGANQAYIPASYFNYCPPQSLNLACASAYSPLCQSRLVICQSQQWVCPSDGWYCPSENIICNSQVCPSLSGNACQSWVDGCQSSLGCTIFDPTTVFDPGYILGRGRFRR